MYSRGLHGGTPRRWRAVGGGRVLGGYSPVLLGYWDARLLRHGRGAARVVLLCAGAYVAGAAGSNVCPAGSARIETEAACRTAVAVVGKTAGSPFGVTSPIPPRGCYYSIITNTAYFNADPVGAGNPNAQLLCAATATAGAPPCTARRCARAYECAAARACAATRVH